MSLPPPPMLPPAPKKKFVPIANAGSITTMIHREREEVVPEEELTAEQLKGSDIQLPKIKCKRCEKDVLESEWDSHWQAHSSEIIDGFMFLGSMKNAHNKKELTIRTRITDILNMAEEVENVFRRCREGCECDDGGIECNGRYEETEGSHLFRYHSMKIKDKAGEDIYPYFSKTYDTIAGIREQNGSRILVHCVQGISRSSSVVIAYLMRENKWCLKKAYDYTRERRAIARPIAHFVEQLQLYEKELAETYQLEGYNGTPSLLLTDVYSEGTRFIGSV